MSLELAVSKICKSYNGKPVLKDCSVSFERGSIHVLTGSNGSGKSTFLKICALLESPDKGTVNYFSKGNIIKNDIGLMRRITLVLPRIGVFNTTVFKNAAYGLKIRGMEKKKIDENVDRTLEFVGLTHKKNHNALTLSSGETQRLGIARSMVIGPEILFLDELTTSIDQENTEIIENIILNMKRDGEVTVIITTHDMAQAERLADRLLIIQAGRIIDKESS